jgi:hypothetical protein
LMARIQEQRREELCPAFPTHPTASFSELSRQIRG